MKKKCCIVLAVLIAGQLHAQPSLDSLQAIWQDPALSDSIRLHAVDELITGTLKADEEARAEELIGVMRSFSETHKDRFYSGRSLIQLSLLHQRRGELDAELSDLQRALDFFKAARSTEEVARTHRRIGWCFRRQGLLDSTIVHAEISLALERERGDSLAVAHALRYLGGNCTNTGDQQRAAEVLTEARAIAEKQGAMAMLSRVDNELGYLYNRQNDLDKALDLYRESYHAAFLAPDAEARGHAMMRIGDVHLERHVYDSARFWLDSSLFVNETVGNDWNTAATLNSLGYLEEQQGRYEEAASFWQRSLTLRRKIKDPNEIALVLNNLSSLDHRKGDHRAAVAKATEALELSEKARFERGIEASTHRLYSSYTAIGNFPLALRMYERHIQVRDSAMRADNQRELLRQEYKYDYDKKALADSLNFAAETAIQQKEVQKQKLMRNGFMGGFALVALFAGVFFFQRNRISKEKARSEELLLNILPEEVAEELKAKGSAEAVHIDQVTVLFTDFKGFTAMSEVVTPQELVRDLNECFSAFDRITGKYGIEKIKTIGDAYMAAGGLPTPNTTHATDVINAALEMAATIAEGKARKIAAGLPYFEVRIGIHTGPVVAGIVGVKKFQYDIWGDTVNTASRMESSGEVGQVNISEATYEVVKDVPGLAFTPRGKVQAKGKGEMEMYFVMLASA